MSEAAANPESTSEMAARRADPETQQQLDDLMSMSVADVDRERLVNRYLDALVRAVDSSEENESRKPGVAHGAR